MISILKKIFFIKHTSSVVEICGAEDAFWILQTASEHFVLYCSQGDS